MAGKPGLSQATADRVGRAGPILHPTKPRRRQFTNPFRLAAVLALVLLVVDLCWALIDMRWPP